MKICLATISMVLVATAAFADALTCNLAEYKASPGLSAAVADNVLALTWEGDKGQELRLRFTINGGTPTIREIAIRRQGAQWATLASHLTPEYRVASGVRRITHQQLDPLRKLGVEITPEIIEREKWNAFWDAPLNVPGGDAAHGGATPPAQAFATHPGLPRRPEEVRRATATYQAQNCDVKTNGARLEVSFAGVQLGIFAGRLEYTVYKGTNLIRQAVIARTDQPSVAYKYDAGLKGLSVRGGTRVVWRDPAGHWQESRLGGADNEAPVALKTGNRIVIAETQSGSIAAFPPPHTFFWAREHATNLGYSWYRKDSGASFSFGIRQAEGEEDPEYLQNFALYNARPGTWQRMPVYFFVSPASAEPILESALAFTRGDRFKPLAGYQVMATHFHTSFARRLRESGSLDTKLPDLEAVKAAGINIFAPIDSGFRGAGDRLKGLADYYEAARRHSDRNFLIMPNEEFSANLGGGDTDLLLSRPLFWRNAARGSPFVEEHPAYGKVYNVGGPAEMMEMVRREHALIFIPHPRSKDSTGYPDAIKDTPQFRDENYRGIGARWGMGLDGSETRLCELRCQALLDEMNNWVADLPTPPKFLMAITETYRQAPGDDIYATGPVNYVKVDPLPAPDDWSPVIASMKRGDYFWTSGEVLIPSYAVQGTGARRTISADVEWTFPLEFVEVVWGDGQKTERQVIPATDLPPFGRHQFTVPFDATGKKWVRFAAWDVAGNGAMVQPVKLSSPPATAAR